MFLPKFLIDIGHIDAFDQEEIMTADKHSHLERKELIIRHVAEI